MKLSVLFVLILSVSMFNGCVTFKSMHDTVEDPIKSAEIQRRLRSQEDIDYWKKVKENNRNAIIILDDP